MTVIAATITIVAAILVVYALTGNRHISLQEARNILQEGQKAYNQNKIIKAFDLIQQARTGFEEHGDSVGIFESSVYLSMLYEDIGQRENAYKLMKSLKFIEAPNLKTFSSQYYLRLKGWYAATVEKDYAEAERLNRQSIEYNKRKYPDQESFVYMDMANLAEMHILQGKYREAEQIVNHLLQSEKPSHKQYLSQVLYCKALIQQHRNQTDSAYVTLDRSLYYSRKYTTYANHLNALLDMARIDSLQGNMPAYFSHKDEHNSLKQWLQGNEVNYKIAMMQEQHKMDIVKQDTERKMEVHRLSLMILTIIIISLAVIIVVAYNNFRARQAVATLERQRLDKAVEIEKMEKELLNLKMQTLDKAYKENIAINIKLANKKNEPDDMTRLEQQLEQVDKSFVTHLETNYPLLTKNDIRILSLIRLGMDTKEIAPLLNITTESLHKSRYRMRKKLGLETGQELETFIKSIS